MLLSWAACQYWAIVVEMAFHHHHWCRHLIRGMLLLSETMYRQKREGFWSILGEQSAIGSKNCAYESPPNQAFCLNWVCSIYPYGGICHRGSWILKWSNVLKWVFVMKDTASFFEKVKNPWSWGCIWDQFKSPDGHWYRDWRWYSIHHLKKESRI